jgi:hypothetical protein
LFSVFCFCFVSLRPVSCVPNVANFSGFYILCPSIFSNIYLFGSFLCIALSTINCMFVLLFTLFGSLYYLSFVTSRLLITTDFNKFLIIRLIFYINPFKSIRKWYQRKCSHRN